MSIPSSLLRVPVEMPNRSGHNCSHGNAFTGVTGTLYPVMVDELLPNDTVSLGSVIQCQLPPMASDFYGKVDVVMEAFFVPNRLLWGGWKDFITHPTLNPVYPAGTPVQVKPSSVPYFYVAPNSDNSAGSYDIPVSSLLHYLDYGKQLSSLNNGDVSVLPAVAYHRIWDDWYRDSRIQAPLFYPGRTDATYDDFLRSLPYNSVYSDGTTYAIPVNTSFIDNVSIVSLRQRNWVKDYFTSASPLPQAGNASEVEFTVDTSTGEGAFTISTLRAANSLQKWEERNNLAGYRYPDQIFAQFGRYPSDAIMDRCLYLGRSVNNVYNKSVYQTTQPTINDDAEGKPVGSKYASSQAIGEGSLVDKFTASEHGFLMVLCSLVPRPVYGSGCERRNFRTKVGDFAFPLLAGMGDQAILARELNGITNLKTEFGYTDLYAEYKFKNDKIHGLLQDGQNLDAFALQRTFTTPTPTISSEFLRIPANAMDQVQSVATSITGYSYWAQCYFPYKKISTIPAYSQPTLADLSNAHTEYISRGGKRL